MHLESVITKEEFIMKKIYTIAAMMFITLQSMADGPGARFSIQQYFPEHLLIEIDGYRYFKHRDDQLTAPIGAGYHQIWVYSYRPQVGFWGLISGGAIGRNLFRGDFFANPYDDILIRINEWGSIDIDRYRGSYSFDHRRWNDYHRRWEYFENRRDDRDRYWDRDRDRDRYRNNDRGWNDRDDRGWNRNGDREPRREGNDTRGRDEDRKNLNNEPNRNEQNGDAEKGREPERIQRPDRNPEIRPGGTTPRRGRG